MHSRSFPAGERYRIALARSTDVPRLAQIEQSAASLLAGHAPESVLAETTAEAKFEFARRNGRLWVALAADVPVGFAHVEILEPKVAHLEEIDVLPEHGRRGLGTRLVAAVCWWAARKEHHTVTLTTFRDVSWNMPFYTRLGFEVIPAGELSPALLAVLRDETSRGLDPLRRVAMRRRLQAVGPVPADRLVRAATE